MGRVRYLVYGASRDRLSPFWSIAPIGLCLLTLLCGILGRTDNAPWLEAFLRATDIVWERPRAFGSFHFTFLIGGVLVAILLSYVVLHFSKDRHLAADCVVFVAALVFLILESYKQLYSYFVLTDMVYDFSIFPFQFCSLPLYLCPIAPFLPRYGRAGRVKSAIYRFLAFYGTIGGAIVLGYPRFTNRLSTSVHTMLWHILMIAIGFLLLLTEECGKHDWRELRAPTGIFLAAYLIGMMLNLTLYPLSAHSPAPLNLFYTSPYETNNYILIRDVREAFGWFPSVLIYLGLFIFVGATLMFGIGFVFQRLLRAKKDKEEK